MRRMAKYIHEHIDWARFRWNSDVIMTPLSRIRNTQGRLMGKMTSLGWVLREDAQLDTTVADILKTSEIEGESLNLQQVRSSVARRMGLNIEGLIPSDQLVDGIVQMSLDASQNFKAPLTQERLFGWHAALFPTGRSGMHKIMVGGWRQDLAGPMQVVSGRMGKEIIHYQAPPAEQLDREMDAFLAWFESEDNIDPVLKAAIAHLWFVSIHPFDDGNGRIARAITDMQLARAEENNRRLYSMSAQISIERNGYYEILEKTQKGSPDITEWILWFLQCLENAISTAETMIEKVMIKSKFWNQHVATPLNARQRMMINTLFDSFFGNLSSSKWATMTKCSPDTALRDIQDLIDKNILSAQQGGGRNAHYELLLPMSE